MRANPQYLLSDLLPHPQHTYPSHLALFLHIQEFKNSKEKTDSHL